MELLSKKGKEMNHVFFSLMVVLSVLAVVLWGRSCFAAEAEFNSVVQSFDWRTSPGINVSRLEDGSFQIEGGQSGKWNYARVTLDLGFFKPGRYVLKGAMRVKSLADDNYPPFLKIGMNNQDGKEFPKKVTRPYDVSALNTTQYFVLRFRIDDRVKNAYLAVEKGTKLENEVSLYIKDLVIERDGDSVEFTKQNKNALEQLVGMHPRLYLRSNSISLLKTRLNQPPYSRFWANTKQVAERYVRQSPPRILPKNTNIRPYGKMLPYLALSYLLSSDERYLDAARKWMDALCAYPNWADNKDLGPAHILAGMAVAYDWLYDDFSPFERDRYRRKITKHATIFHDLVVNQSIYWSRDYLHNHNHVDAGALGIAGLALYGESPHAVEWVMAAEENFRTVLDVLPPDGAWYEGVSYWSYAMEALLRYFDAMAPVFGMDRVKQHPFFKNATRYRLHMSLPGFEKIISYGDSADIDWYGPGYLLRRLASLYSDGNAQWLANKIEEARGNKPLFDWQSWLDLIWYDDAIPTVAPDLSINRAYFSDLGLYIRRSDWTKSATLFFFKAGPPQGLHAQSLDRFVAGHPHPDEGTFYYWLDGDWVIPAAGYVHKKMTWNNNVLLFNGVGQLGEGGMWFDEKRDVERYRGDAYIEEITNQKSYSMITADLTKIMHPSANVVNWKRSVVVEVGKLILIRDVVDLNSDGDVDSYIHFGKNKLFEKKDGYSYLSSGGKIVNVNFYGCPEIQKRRTTIKLRRPKGKTDISKCINARLNSVTHGVLLTIISTSSSDSKSNIVFSGKNDSDLVNFKLNGKAYSIDFVNNVMN